MRKKSLQILFLTLLIDMIGIGMIIPIIPIIFTDPSSPSFLLQGYSQAEQYFVAGLVTALFGFMQFLAAPILGELSDVYGRKKLLTIGVGVLALSQLLFGFGIEIGSLWLLFFSRAVAGLAGANFSIAQASIADVTDPKDRAKNFGLIGAAFGIGFIVGPILGGWIAHFANNPAAPFWLATFLGVINVVSISLFLPETNKNKSGSHNFHFFKGLQNIRAAWRDKDARPVYLSSFLYVAGFSFFASFSGVYLVQRFGLSATSIGTYFGVVGGWIVFTQLFILRIISRKYAEKTILRVSLLVLASSLVIYPFLPTTLLVFALIPFLAIPNGLSIANMGALVSKSVSADKQGAALGINGSLMALSQGLIPLLAGIFSGFIGIAAPFVIGAFLIFMGWANLFIFSRRT